MINYQSILKNIADSNISVLYYIILFLIIIWFNISASLSQEHPLNFRTINISNGLSHNMVNAIYKDHRGFVWLGTQLGLDRFDGISIVNYPQLKNHSVFTICETDSIYLWIGIDKGLMRLNRKTDKAEYIMLGEKQTTVRAIYPVSSHTLLVGTLQGLFIVNDKKVEKVNLGVGALSRTNTIYEIIAGKEDKTYWIATNAGLIYFNLNNRKSAVYKCSEENLDLNNYYCLTMYGDMLYIGMRNVGVMTFDTLKKCFKLFPYEGNPYITTISVISDTELCIGTNGGGIKIVSMQTGEILHSIEHTSDGSGINSNAVYSFLKDGNIYWVGTYMGGLSYTPVIGNKFSVYAFGNKFNSLHHNVRSFWIADDGRKLIGTRDGLIYISETEHIIRKYSTKTSILQADIILSIYPLNDEDVLIGTFGGGLYKFHCPTQSLLYFGVDECFRRGSYSNFNKDRDGNLFISSSYGIYVYNLTSDKFIHYTDINSNLKSNTIYATLKDTDQHIWYGTGDGVCMYDLNTKAFRSNMFPPHIQTYTKSVRFIFEDSNKNLWFCDDKEGIVKVDESFEKFEHLTTANFFFSSNSVTSIAEDETGGLWFSTQRGLFYYRDNGSNIQFYSLYDGIPGYVFNNWVQETADGTIWWGNEEGLVCYNERENNDKESYYSSSLPAITTISVAGKTLHAGDKGMPYAPDYMKNIDIAANQSIEFTFSALNYSQMNSDIYEYQLEGYDDKWRVLMNGNKVSYLSLPQGKYIFKVRLSSLPERITSMIVHVHWNVSIIIWVILICVITILIFFFIFRIQAKYWQSKGLSKTKEGSYSKEKYAKARIEDIEVNAIRTRLFYYMQNEKPYLNTELKLQDISNAISCSSVELSQLLNMHMNTNFTDFVNQYRIDEFIMRVQDKSAIKYTLTSLSEQSGFSSRTSFFRSFKKIKGTTPAEYIKEMRIELKK